jgi:hypothetical protein
MEEMCMEGQRSAMYISFVVQGRCQPAWDPFFVIKESFLLRFRMDYTTINYV